MLRKVKFLLSLPVKLYLSALGISEQWLKIQCQGMHRVIIYNDAVQMANACSACVHGMTSCNLVWAPSQRGTQKPVRSLLSAQKCHFVSFPLVSSHKRADFFLLSSASFRASISQIRFYNSWKINLLLFIPTPSPRLLKENCFQNICFPLLHFSVCRLIPQMRKWDIHYDFFFHRSLKHL